MTVPAGRAVCCWSAWAAHCHPVSMEHSKYPVPCQCRCLFSWLWADTHQVVAQLAFQPLQQEPGPLLPTPLLTANGPALAVLNNTACCVHEWNC
jgi:hypothetical protein